ncbi:peroxiredoxin [Orrella sp. JC864]|uniref:peroxiredoxin n=1 Tax=Orrella sp. JC864 TaxID=3120298 RepID=UPI003008EB4F
MIPTRRLALLAVPLVLALGSVPARAALEVGERAPDFTAPAALAGKPFEFRLSQALAQGPVVLYFYPAAFTQGCTIEANSFAQAIDDYKAVNATVIGVSGDDMDTLSRFSVTACGGKFAVASDSKHRIMKDYDVEHAVLPGVANRVSFVISPQGRIIYQYASSNPHQHVDNTLQAVRRWHAESARAR